MNSSRDEELNDISAIQYQEEPLEDHDELNQLSETLQTSLEEEVKRDVLR